MEFSLFCTLFAIVVKALALIQALEISKNVGDVVVLSCQNTPGNSVVQWLRLNSTSLGSPFKTLTDGWTIYCERLRILGDVRGDNYDLEISDIRSSDAGLYRCAVERSTDPFTDIVLNVADTPADTISPEVDLFNFTLAPTDHNTTEISLGKLLILPVIVSSAVVLFAVVIYFAVGYKCFPVQQNTLHINVVNMIDGQNETTIHPEFHFEIPNTVHTDAMSNSGNIQDTDGDVGVVQEEASGTGGDIRTFHVGDYNNPYQILSENEPNNAHAYEKLLASKKHISKETSDVVIYDECGQLCDVQNPLYQSLIKERINTQHIYM